MHNLKMLHSDCFAFDSHRRLYRRDFSSAGDRGSTQRLPKDCEAACQQHAENGKSHCCILIMHHSYIMHTNDTNMFCVICSVGAMQWQSQLKAGLISVTWHMDHRAAVWLTVCYTLTVTTFIFSALFIVHTVLSSFKNNSVYKTIVYNSEVLQYLNTLIFRIFHAQIAFMYVCVFVFYIVPE